MENNTALCPFDQFTIGNSTRMIKLLIPYLEPYEQRMLAILVRLNELMLTIKYYNINHIEKQEFNSNDDMLSLIKSCCSKELAGTLDTMMKIFSMSDMLSVLSNLNPDSNETPDMAGLANIFNMMSQENGNNKNTFPMFNEHQNELYDQYMNELDNLFVRENLK